MSEIRRLWGDNIRRGRALLNNEGSFRSADQPAMSQVRLAQLLDVTQQSVSEWERGTSAPRDDMKVRLAEVLHQDVRQLFPLVRPLAATR